MKRTYQEEVKKLEEDEDEADCDQEPNVKRMKFSSNTEWNPTPEWNTYEGRLSDLLCQDDQQLDLLALDLLSQPLFIWDESTSEVLTQPSTPTREEETTMQCHRMQRTIQQFESMLIGGRPGLCL